VPQELCGGAWPDGLPRFSAVFPGILTPSFRYQRLGGFPERSGY
jgi:hypothetical protein